MISFKYSNHIFSNKIKNYPILFIILLLFTYSYQTTTNTNKNRNLQQIPFTFNDNSHIKIASPLPYTSNQVRLQSTTIFYNQNENYFVFPTYIYTFLPLPPPAKKYLKYHLSLCSLPNINCILINFSIDISILNIYINTVRIDTDTYAAVLLEFSLSNSQLRLYKIRINKNNPLNGIVISTLNLSLPNYICRYIVKVENIIVSLVQSTVLTTSFRLIKYNLNTETLSQTSISLSILNHSFIVDYKVFLYKNKYLIFGYYEISSLVLCFYDYRNETTFTKSITIDVYIVNSLSYEYQEINNDSFIVISYIILNGSPLIENKLFIKKIYISGDSSSTISLSISHNEKSFFIEKMRTVQYFKWSGAWIILNLYNFSLKKSILYTFLLVDIEKNYINGHLKSKTILINTHSILDMFLFEAKSSRKSKPIVISIEEIPVSTYISRVYYIESSTFPVLRSMFFNNIDSQMAYECKKNEYFSMNTNLECQPCQSGYVNNNQCVIDPGLCPLYPRLSFVYGYCPDESTNYYFQSSLQLTRENLNSSKANCQGSLKDSITNQISKVLPRLATVNNICVDCQQLGMVLLYDKCEESCPIGYRLNTFNECELFECGDGYILNPITNECISCGDKYKFNIYTETCVNSCVSEYYSLNGVYCECGNGYFLMVDTDYNTCIPSTYQCRYGSLVRLSSGYSYCVNPESKRHSIGTECGRGLSFNYKSRRCEKCSSDKQFSFDNSCYDKCPLGTITNYNDNICVRCISNGYVYKNICYEKCPDDTIPIESQRICVNKCGDDNGSCVITCPISNYYYDKSSKECYECPSYAPFRYNYNCVYDCPTRSYLDNNKQCIDCKPDEIFYADSSYCTTTCPTDNGYTLVSSIKICFNCLKKGLYYNFELGKCASYCPFNYVPHTKLGCVFEGYVIYNDNILLSGECPEGYYPSWNRICYECPVYKIRKSICTSKCDEGKFPDSTNTCKTCLEMNLLTSSSGECVYSCNYQIEYLDELNKRCLLKTKNLSETLLYSNDLSCNLQCRNQSQCKTKRLLSTKNSLYCNICGCSQGFYGRLCEFTENIKNEYEKRLVLLMSRLPSIDKSNDDYIEYIVYMSSNDFQLVSEVLRIVIYTPQLLKSEYIFKIFNILSYVYRYNQYHNTFDIRVFSLINSLFLMIKVEECYDRQNSNEYIHSVIERNSNIETILYSSIKEMSIDYSIPFQLMIQNESFKVYAYDISKDIDDIVSGLRLPYFQYNSCINSTYTNNKVYSIVTTIDYSCEGEVFNLTNYKINDLNEEINSKSLDFTSTQKSFLHSSFKSGRSFLISVTNSTSSIIKDNILTSFNCSNDKYTDDIYVKLPINYGFNKTDYNRLYQERSIDIFNNASGIYNDICFSYSNSTLKCDVPILKRRELYDKSIFCRVNNDYLSEVCMYKEIDNQINYAICKCNPNDIIDKTISNTIDSSIFSVNLSEFMIYEVIKCFPYAFQYKFYENIGFYSILLIELSTILLVILLQSDMFIKGYIKRNVDNILSTDGCFVIDTSRESDNKENNLPALVGITNSDKNSKEVKEVEGDVNKEKEKEKEINLIKQEEEEERKPKCKIQILNKEQTIINKVNNEVEKNKKKTTSNKLNSNQSKQEEKSNTQSYVNESSLRFNIFNIYREIHNINQSNQGKTTEDGSKFINNNQSIDYNHLERIVLSYKDTEVLNVQYILDRDTRSSISYLWYHLKNYHILLSIFTKKSIVISVSFRVMKASLSIVNHIIFNIFFTSIDYIDKKYMNSLNQRSVSIMLDYEVQNRIYSSLCSIILLFLICNILFLSNDNRIYMEINSLLVKKDYDSLINAYNLYKTRIKRRFYCGFSMNLIIKSLCFAYFIGFSLVFPYTSIDILYFSLISLVVDWILIRPLLSLVVVFLRYIARTCQHECQRRVYYYIKSILERVL